MAVWFGAWADRSSGASAKHCTFHGAVLRWQCKAQLGVPDMLPIEYALTFPTRCNTTFERINFSTCGALTFEQPDLHRFRNLALAFEAMSRGGNMPCVLNAANEVVVAAFLKDKIVF